MITLNALKNLTKYIIGEEGCRLVAYLDTGKIWTIGFGHTSDSYFEVKEGTTITKDEAYDLLRYDLSEAEKTLHAEIKVVDKLNENQYIALLSIIYNAGSLKVRKEGKWVTSSLMYYVNNLRWKDAAEEIKVFKTRDRKGSEVLKKRRERESALFMKVPSDENKKMIASAEKIEPKGVEHIA